MNQLIYELKVKIIETLNLIEVTPDTIDENTQLVGGDLGLDSIDNVMSSSTKSNFSFASMRRAFS